MTTAQIAHVIGGRGYSVDTWTDLADFPLINMGQDTNFYTDTARIRVNFNTTTENMEIVYGSVIGPGFVSDALETAYYTPVSFIPFSSIIALLRSVLPGPQGTYYKRYFGTAKRLDYTQN